MKKITILLLLLLLAVSQGAFAQRTITGKVIGGEEGPGMSGVAVVVKGTTTGTATDVDGNFTLNVPNSATIVVSFLGFRPVELTVGNQNRFDIVLRPDDRLLEDVIVKARNVPIERVETALGIQRDKKTLTYSLQQVSGAEMRKAQDPNFMNSLNGKVAGLDAKKVNSGPGGSTIALIRGYKSFTGDSAPLYVIDGVPMTNRGGVRGNVDEGDSLSQLNPDDIESVTVLRGANAAILYGSEGANGVILITLKKR